MDPKRVYAPESREAEGKPRAKSKAPAVVPNILDSRTYADAAAVLRTLESGLTSIEAELDALAIENFLGSRPASSKKPRPDSREATLQDRLNKHRAKSPASEDIEPVGRQVPSVARALEIIKGSRTASRVDRKTLIAQLERDQTVVREAIGAQVAIVDQLRNDLSAAMAMRLVGDHRKLMVAIFRGAQALAAATDAQNDFRESVTGAGYIWRTDLLTGPQLRGALVLGSERDFDSDISRARRALEELKWL